MSTEHPITSVPVTPITSLDDPRAITILSTEHWSLLSSRGRSPTTRRSSAAGCS